MKEKCLFILSVVTFGWTSHLYLNEKMKNRIDNSKYEGSVDFDIGFTKSLSIPLYVIALMMFCVLGGITFVLFAPLFGSWFVFLSIAILLMITFTIPTVIYLASSAIIYNNLTSDTILDTPVSKNDHYIYKRIGNEED